MLSWFDSREASLEVDPVIEALKSDDIVDKVGGRFKLTALIQRRLKEIVVDGGSSPD